MVREAQKGQGKGTGTRNTCLLCNEPGHNYRQCLWHWAWLLTEEHDHMETMSTVPNGTRDLLNRQRHLEIMETGRALELQVEQTISIGLTIVANQNDLGALNRYAERLERQELAQELGQVQELAQERILLLARVEELAQERILLLVQVQELAQVQEQNHLQEQAQDHSLYIIYIYYLYNLLMNM
jgi:hypothetical protein